MQKISYRAPFPSLRRPNQITLSHCGPATLQMLLYFLGKRVSQKRLVEAVRVQKKIKTYGTFVKELGRAVAKTVPDVQFWYKQRAKIQDLKYVVHKLNYPVGVEWQGVFEEADPDDDGHYSVVTYIDTRRDKNVVRLFDPFPYRPYPKRDRKFSVQKFVARWWDINAIPDKKRGRRKRVLDHRLMFVITPKETDFPKKLGMRRI